MKALSYAGWVCGGWGGVGGCSYWLPCRPSLLDWAATTSHACVFMKASWLIIAWNNRPSISWIVVSVWLKSSFWIHNSTLLMLINNSMPEACYNEPMGPSQTKSDKEPLPLLFVCRLGWRPSSQLSFLIRNLKPKFCFQWSKTSVFIYWMYDGLELRQSQGLQ